MCSSDLIQASDRRVPLHCTYFATLATILLCQVMSLDVVLISAIPGTRKHHPRCYGPVLNHWRSTIWLRFQTTSYHFLEYNDRFAQHQENICILEYFSRRKYVLSVVMLLWNNHRKLFAFLVSPRLLTLVFDPIASGSYLRC